MYNLGLEKAEEPEIKLPTFIGPWRKVKKFQKPSRLGLGLGLGLVH